MALSNAHRASVLKQQNKKHKNIGHRTKGQLKSLSRGRISIQSILKSHKSELSKQQRKHQLKQIRSNKREEAISKKRQLGSGHAPPFLIAILPVNSDINPRIVLNYLSDHHDSSSPQFSDQGIMHLNCPRLKQRFSFVIPPVTDLYAILDTVKICDTVLFVWKVGEDVSYATENILSCLQSQGMPSTVHTVIEDEDLPHKNSFPDGLEYAFESTLNIHQFNPTKKKVRQLKELQMEIASRFGGSRSYVLNKTQDVNLILRQIGAQKRKPVFYRDRRSHIMAEKVVFEEGDTSSGTLKLYGYVRGQPLSVNKLIHIPGWGEFQIGQLDSLDDPFPLDLNRSSKMDPTPIEEDPRVLDHPDPKLQETLDSYIDVEDEFDEQTWPTPEEIKEAMEESENMKKNRKLPRGTSDYQASWIMDDSGDEDDDDDDPDIELSGDMCVDPAEAPLPPSESSDDEVEEGRDDVDNETLTDVADDYDDRTDYSEEMTVLQKLRAARQDSQFPDEVDTPMDMPSRVRFQKYRGLQSFRTSPWDRNENLPPDYRRIVYFKSFDQTKRRVFNADKDGAVVGWYVIVHLKNVPRHLYVDHLRSQSPLVAFSLLPYEQKISVVNVLLKSNPTGHTVPIRSKERLIFHVGFRRFANAPIFSEHTTGDKHKFIRYFQPGQTVVASMFAPITFPSCPVSVFRLNEDGSQQLIASGPLLTADPNRIIVKRTVLSGHPFKINRKSAFVRYMFFNAEDVLWFKSVELRTKWGRRGHIKDPLGTHGHMKCQFDGQLKSQDSVLLNLYKRVFPKWRFDPQVPRNPPLYGTLEPPLNDFPETDGNAPEKKKKRVTFGQISDR